MVSVPQICMCFAVAFIAIVSSNPAPEPGHGGGHHVHHIIHVPEYHHTRYIHEEKKVPVYIKEKVPVYIKEKVPVYIKEKVPVYIKEKVPVYIHKEEHNYDHHELGHYEEPKGHYEEPKGHYEPEISYSSHGGHGWDRR